MVKSTDAIVCAVPLVQVVPLYVNVEVTISTTILASDALYTVSVTALDSEELLWFPSPKTLNLTDVAPMSDLDGFAVRLPLLQVTVAQEPQVVPSVDIAYCKVPPV